MKRVKRLCGKAFANTAIFPATIRTPFRNRAATIAQALCNRSGQTLKTVFTAPVTA